MSSRRSESQRPKKTDATPLVDAKRSTVVADRLRATEEALKTAQALIAQQQQRETELKRMLTTGGTSFDVEPSTLRRKLPSTSNVDDQLQAMKTVHDTKVRALMKSIHQLQEQLQTLKSQDKEHRRSALIQNLRASQREQELLIDVLKQTLVEKVAEFQDSRELVNDFILKKAIGGPLRFRPPSREELESDLSVLEGKYKRVVESLKKAKEESESKRATTKSQQKNRQQPNEKESEEDDLEREKRNSRPITVEKEVYVVDPALQEEIDRLQIELTSKNLTIHAQADEMHELYAEVERLRVLEDKFERKKDKIDAMDDRLNKLQLENVRLMHERVAEIEKNAQLSEEIQFLRDSRVGDVQASDSERLRQLELVESLRARELALQSEIEEQQKKWSIDRTTIHQQMRLLEKEKDLVQETLQRSEEDLQVLQKKHDKLFVEYNSLQTKLSEVHGQNEALQSRIQELEDTVALHENLSREERENHTKLVGQRVREMEQQLADKEELAKKLDRQLTASKLLARQAKKEKEQLQERCTKLQEELVTLRQSK